MRHTCDIRTAKTLVKEIKHLIKRSKQMLDIQLNAFFMFIIESFTVFKGIKTFLPSRHVRGESLFVCLFDFLLYVHGKQLMSCWDGQSS